MSSLNLKIQEIEKSDFRLYLKTKRDSVLWFYWHLNSNLDNFRTYEIIKENRIIGVICIEKSTLPFVDIYIDREYRGLGYGSLTIKYLSINYGKVKFKVNLYNKKSIDFFEKLMSHSVVKFKHIEEECIKYYS